MSTNPFAGAFEAAVNFFMDSNFKGPIVWDIETGPQPDDRLRKLHKFNPTSIKGYELIGTEFDESTVAYGNTKDEEKRSAKRDTAYKKFVAARKKAEEELRTGEAKSFEEFRNVAALDARTCQVLAIGYLDLDSGQRVMDDGGGDEQELLEVFWTVFTRCRSRSISMIGFNTSGFDVPICARRGMLHKVDVPPFLTNNRYIDKTFVDLLETWRCGNYRLWIKLDELAEFFGCTRKNGDGAMFHKLWNGSPEERQQAIDYLSNDLDMTAEVARAMQVV